jgi:hypothetical protein
VENAQFPIVVKKRNGFMIGVSITEIIIGIIWGITTDGLKSIVLWVFIFVGIVTALSVLVEYSQDVFLKENKMEFYKNKDLIKEIKYSNIKSIYISKGNEQKTKKKDFVAIEYNENNKKNSASCNYLIDPMSYTSKDLIIIKDTILKKNSAVKVSEELVKFIK